jgi:hypothetical protein
MKVNNDNNNYIHVEAREFYSIYILKKPKSVWVEQHYVVHNVSM